MPDEAPLPLPGQGTFPPDLPRQTEARRGLSVSYRGKTLLSCLDPIAQAERLVAGLQFPDRTLYFCPSPLYGYGLDRLMEKLEQAGPHSAVLCVETDEQLLALSRSHFPPSLLNHPRLRLTGAAGREELCALVRKAWGSRSFRRVETLRLSAGWRLSPDLYDALADSLRQEIVLDWSNAATLIRLGRLYSKNAVRNLALIPRSSSLSGLSFHQDPILVLGAGPSLDGILEGITAFFGDMFPAAPELPGQGVNSPSRSFKIVAVDTALPCLRAHGIKPDLVVALESQHWNLRDFIGAGGWEIPVAMDLSALPATREMLGGRIFLFFTPWAELSLFRRLAAVGLLPPAFPPLGSVSLTAAAIALSLGSGPVLTGGIDFSFTADNYHARATPGHQEKLRRQNRFRSVLNADAAFRPAAFRAAAKSGASIRSDPAMRGYRDLFEREFAGEPRLRDIISNGLPLGPLTVDIAAACEILGSGHPPTPAGSVAQASDVATAGDAATADGGARADNAALRGFIIRERDSLVVLRRILTGDGTAVASGATLRGFIIRERDSLVVLRRILTGETKTSPEELEKILDDVDYLWAHFPDCAGTGGRRPPGTDISFLKRVRAEIDPFIRLWELADQDI
jgi:hypothetical protein